MTTETLDVIDVLNDLLAWEARNLLPHLRDSTVFLSWASADERRSVERMIDESLAHQARLVDTLTDLGATPLPATPDIHAAELHFLDLRFALRRVAARLKELVAAYEAAAGQVAGNKRASETVSEIAAAKRRHLDLVTRFVDRAHGNNAPAA